MKKNLINLAYVKAKHLHSFLSIWHLATMNEAMMEEFCGEDYKRTLETKLGTIKFTRESDIPLFSLELKKLIKELYRIEDDKTLKLIVSNHVVAELEP